jgi:hypothetical protein
MSSANSNLNIPVSSSHSTNSSTIELTLMGQKIVLKTSADPKKVEAIVSLVKERLEQSEKRLKGNSAPHLAAILALFDLGEEYLEAKKRTQDHLLQIETRTKSLTDWIRAEI